MTERSYLRYVVMAVLAGLISPVMAQSVFDGGDGSPWNPYRVSNADQLLAIGSDPNLLDEFFVLTKDIDLSSRSFTGAVIAAPPATFTGRFDGAGYAIVNLTIDPSADEDPNNDGADRLALFGTIDTSGEVRNLAVKDVVIRGGRAGSKASDILGALCGLNRGRIRRCYATGLVITDGSSLHFGGLCGANQSGTIQECFSDADVIGGEDAGNIGGLCGFNEEGRIIDCYATADVTGGPHSHYVGGLVGLNSEGDVERCYATGWVTVGEMSDWVGGFCGNNGFDGIVDACFWDVESSHVEGSDGGVGLPTSQMQQPDTFAEAGWDFVGNVLDGTNDTWRLCGEGAGYPRLAWEFARNGDFTCPDGVGIEDMGYYAVHWLGEGGWDEGFQALPDPPEIEPIVAGAADATGDFVVNLLDFARLAANWLHIELPLLVENFDDGDFAGWTVVDQGVEGDPASNWAVQEGVLTQSNRIFSRPGNSPALLKLGTFIKYDGGYGWSDYAVSCLMRSDWTNDYGIMFRVQDDNNYYRFSWRNTPDPGSEYPPYTRIVKVVGGEASMLAERRGFSFQVGQWHQVTLRVKRSDILLYVDGELVLSARDDALSQGTIALYCFANRFDLPVYFDDVVVTDLQVE